MRVAVSSFGKEPSQGSLFWKHVRVKEAKVATWAVGFSSLLQWAMSTNTSWGDQVCALGDRGPSPSPKCPFVEQ